MNDSWARTMLKHLPWQSWGIAARLLVVAVLPASVMAAVVTFSLHWGAQQEVRRDVNERGRLIAAALAQSSQYGLVSGNSGYLRTTLGQMLQTDPSIDCLELFDARPAKVVSACQPGGRPPQGKWVSRPVLLEASPDVDLFAPLPEPTLRSAPLRRVGEVRVRMTPEPLLKAKRKSLLVASGVVVASALLSCLVGWHLASNLRETFAAVMRALREVRRGKFDVQLNPEGQGELSELRQTIIDMATTLGAARHDLEQQVASRTNALQQAVNAARQADAEKRRLIVHSNAAVEDERLRIALEIHDQLGASLIAVRLEASALQARADALHDDGLTRGARRIATITQALYTTTRDIVKSLRPEVIDTLGLTGALDELVSQLDAAQSDCQLAFSADANVPNLRGELAMPLYRVTQEALTNAFKHAKATRVEVHLSMEPKGRVLQLAVTDNGQGFDPALPCASGIGLIGMRERIAAAAGQISVTSAIGQGTRVMVTLPITQG